MAQKRLSDFFLSVSKQTRNENEDKTVERLELNQKDEKDKQDVEKGKRVTTLLRKLKVEAVVSLAGVVYNSGKMFCLCCCEYGNLSSASSPFATGG